MLAVRETNSYTPTRNEIIGAFVASIGVILLALLARFCIVTYAESTRPIEPSHELPHYVHTRTLRPEPSITIHDGTTTSNPAANSD